MEKPKYFKVKKYTLIVVSLLSIAMMTIFVFVIMGLFNQNILEHHAKALQSKFLPLGSSDGVSTLL